MGKYAMNSAGGISSAVTFQQPSDFRYLAPDATGTLGGKTVLTLDQAVANLTRTGGQWNLHGAKTITYTFLDKAPGGLYQNPHETYLAGIVQNFSPFTADQRDAARASIQLWDDLIAPSFKESNGKGADIVFMNTGDGGPGQAAAFIPTFDGKYNKIDGDVYVNGNQPDNYDLYYGGYGQTTITHEIGHAIGLSHTGDYNATDKDGNPVSPTYAKDAKFFQDTYQYSIMSYFNSGNSGARGYVNWATGGYYQTPQTPMVHDIAAAQALYGADLTTRAGNTTYGFNSNAGNAVYDFTVNKDPFLSIYDAGGNDTLDLSGWHHPTILDLRPGAFSSGFGSDPDAAALDAMFHLDPAVFTQTVWTAIYEGRTSNPGFLSDNIGIAYNTIIENGVTGSGNDILRGNDVANHLDGGAGNDTMTGAAGNDIFIFANNGSTDTITDFATGADKIDLTRVSGVGAGDVSYNSSTHQVQIDTNHDHIADMFINSVNTVGSGDYLFHA